MNLAGMSGQGMTSNPILSPAWSASNLSVIALSATSRGVLPSRAKWVRSRTVAGATALAGAAAGAGVLAPAAAAADLAAGVGWSAPGTGRGPQAASAAAAPE